MIKLPADSESRVIGRLNGVRLEYVMNRFRSEIDVQTFVTLPKLHPNFNQSSECHSKLIITLRD
jgi:hypothetical protein